MCVEGVGKCASEHKIAHFPRVSINVSRVMIFFFLLRVSLCNVFSIQKSSLYLFFTDLGISLGVTFLGRSHVSVAISVKVDG